MRVLVVEDEAKVARAVSAALARLGFAIDTAYDGEEAWFAASTESYAAVILDLGLPKLDGLAVLKRLRGEGIAVPILVLSARGTWSERVAGINAGADDYLPKPFQMEELVARLQGLIRRSIGKITPAMGDSHLQLDPHTATVRLHGTTVDLTQMEYRLLYHLMTNRGRVVSMSELSDELYSHNNEREFNAVEVLVGRLRKKIGREAIETRRGFGYVFMGHAQS
jgi:two-component system OmpR family response regulator